MVARRPLRVACRSQRLEVVRVGEGAHVAFFKQVPMQNARPHACIDRIEVRNGRANAFEARVGKFTLPFDRGFEIHAAPPFFRAP